MSELKLKQLQSAAKELNEVLGLTDPPIKVVGVSKEDLEEKIIEAAGLIVEGEEDAFSDQTIDVINALTEDLDEEEEDLDEEEEDLDEEEEPKKAKEPKPKKAKEPKPKKAKESKPKKAKEPSAYGTAIEIMATDPDMDSKTLAKKLEKKGIDVAKKKSAVTTAFSQFRNVVKNLRKQGKME